MKYKKSGKIITNGIWLEKHEYDTVVLLSNLGYDIEFIRPSTIKGKHSPDITINGAEWEIKSPTSPKYDSLEQIIKRAAKQAPSVVIDLRRLKGSDDILVKRIEQIFTKHNSIKRIKIITKKLKIIEK